MKKSLFTLLVLVFVVATAAAQSVLGKWKTIDDETGKPKSIVELYEKNGKVYGRILELLERKDDPICDLCTDDRKNKKMKGLEIIRDMKKSGSEYADGTILDPKKGKIYDCKLWVEPSDPNKLNVRGYIAFFFRTQTWYRVK